MKDKLKLKKAYWVAWKWPEVYSDDTWVIWLSRMIAIAMPAGLVALTLLTGIPLLGWAATGVLAAFLVLAIILLTVRLFYQEYPTVEEFEAQGARVKQFFHGFPAITNIPMIELEPDEWVAYGHVDPVEFVSAVQLIIHTATGDYDKAHISATMVDSVGHLHATFRNPAEGHWDEGIDLCKHTTEGSFPITRLNL